MSALDDLFSVESKVVLVTGASRGIGLGIASYLSDLGATVVGVARTVLSDAELNFDYRPLDIKSEDEVRKLCESIADKYGRIDALINAAGISLHSTAVSDAERFLGILESNLVASYSCVQSSAIFMNSGSSIINISSIGAKVGFPNNPGYQASKGGLCALTRSLAYDLSPRGIRVNSILPGYIKTSMTIASYEDRSARLEREERTLLKRWGKVEDLFGAVVYLVSGASSYVTGTEIVVDGGWLVKGL